MLCKILHQSVDQDEDLDTEFCIGVQIRIKILAWLFRLKLCGSSFLVHMRGYKKIRTKLVVIRFIFYTV